ncbi:cell wall glucanase [Botrytis cinerea]
MTESHTSQPWDLSCAIELHNLLSASTLNSDLPYSYYFLPEDEPSFADRSARTLGDFTPIWDHLGVDATATCQDSDVEPNESAPSSYISEGLFSDLNSLPSSATDDSDIPDIYQDYVTKSRTVRSKDKVQSTKFPKLQQRGTREKVSEDLISFPKETSIRQISKTKTDFRSPFPADRLFHVQSPRLHGKIRGRHYLMHGRMRMRAADLNRRKKNTVLRKGVIYPLYDLTREEKRIRIAEKLSNQLRIDRKLSGGSSDVEAIHVFVDFSNIIIGFKNTLKCIRGFPEQEKMAESPPFSFCSLASIMERARPVARRILLGSRLNNKDTPTHFEEARTCGYETSVLDRVFKIRELTTEKARGGQGNGYLTGQSSKPENSVSSQSAKSAFVEQGVDEILQLKMIESLADYSTPSTVILATGDGAEASTREDFSRVWREHFRKDGTLNWWLGAEV